MPKAWTLCFALFLFSVQAVAENVAVAIHVLTKVSDRDYVQRVDWELKVTQPNRVISISFETWRNDRRDISRLIRQALETEIAEDDHIQTLLIDTHGRAGKWDDPMERGRPQQFFNLQLMGSVSESAISTALYNTLSPLQNRLNENAVVVLVVCHPFNGTESENARIAEMFLNFLGARNGTIIGPNDVLWMNELNRILPDLRRELKKRYAKILGALGVAVHTTTIFFPQTIGYDLFAPLLFASIFIQNTQNGKRSAFFRDFSRKRWVRGYAIHLSEGVTEAVTPIRSFRRVWGIIKQSCEDSLRNARR